MCAEGAVDVARLLSAPDGERRLPVGEKLEPLLRVEVADDFRARPGIGLMFEPSCFASEAAVYSASTSLRIAKSSTSPPISF